MKTIVNLQTYVRIKGTEKWYSTSIKNHFFYAEPKETTTIECNTFDELLTFCKKKIIYNADINYTLFKNKPYVKISAIKDSFFEEWDITMKEKNFKPVEFKITCKEDTSPSLDFLARYLPNKDFIDYVKSLDLDTENVILSLTK